MLAASLLLISSPLLCHSLGLVSHQLHDLTPAPYLNKHHSSQYSAPAFLGYRDKPINVYRDTSDITDQAELTDAISVGISVLCCIQWEGVVRVECAVIVVVRIGTVGHRAAPKTE